MSLSNITLESGGKVWQGLQSLRISKSMDTLHHSFSFVTTDRFQEGVARWNIRGGSDISLFFDNDLIFYGQASEYNVDIGEETHRIDVLGDSFPINLVECGHEGPYYWRRTTYERIVQDVLTPYGMTAVFSKPLLPLPVTGFRVAVDTSAFEIVRKIAEINGLTVISSILGTIILTDGSDATGSTVLGRGDYVALKTKQDISKAHSKIIVKSQKNDFADNFNSAQRAEVVKVDASQPLYRPLVIIHTGEEDEQDIFAQYAKQRFSGDSIFASVTVKSIYDKQGQLWDINQLVHLNEPYADIDDQLLIWDYELNIDETSGLSVTLGLRLPQTAGSSNFSPRAARRSGGFFSDVLGAIFG